MQSPPVLQIDRSMFRSLREFDKDRIHWLDRAADLGPITCLKLGRVATWVVSDVDVARRVLLTDSTQWVRPPTLVTPVRLSVGENLFTQNSRDWSTFQPQIAAAFRSKAFDHRVEQLGEIVHEALQSNGFGVAIDLATFAHTLLVQTTCWLLFATRIDWIEASALSTSVKGVVEWAGTRVGEASGFLPFALGPKARIMREARTTLRTFASNVLNNIQAADFETPSLIESLHNAVDARGRALSTQARIAHVLGLLFAGIETTSAALSWCLIEAARHPSTWQAIRTANTPKSPKSPDDAVRLRSQSSAFVAEILRCHPPAWGIPRTPATSGLSLTAQDVSADVRRGAIVNIHLLAIHRDETIWHDATTFSPLRHAHASSAEHRALIAFGLGPRHCIGQHIALTELREITATIASVADISIDRIPSHDPHFALRPKGVVNIAFGQAHSVVPT